MQPPAQDPDNLPPEPQHLRVVLVDALLAAVLVAAVAAIVLWVAA
jgi:hypothetical protein